MSETPKGLSELSGTTIDKYNLIRLVGEGGMGAVYEARHTLVKKRCALKILHPVLSKNQEVVQRMLREAQAAAAIGHPNIVETHDFGETPDGTYYLVMEYLEGWSLAGMLQKHPRLDVDTAVAIIIQVLSALVAAHAKGIVHRDLKPDNIFIAKSRRGGEEVKLLDFGISKFTLEGPDDLHLTRTGAVLGTPNYMSPEQASGKGTVDRRSDLWAVGVILYQTLTGQLPFTGKNYNELMFDIVQTEPVLPSNHRPELPEPLERVILKALSKDKNSRFQSAPDMVEALLPFYDREKSELERFVLRQTIPPSDPKRAAGTVLDASGQVSAPTIKTPDGTLTGPSAAGPGPASAQSVATQAYDGPLFRTPGTGVAPTEPLTRQEPSTPGATITPSQIAGRHSVIFGRRISKKTGLIAAAGVFAALVIGVVTGILVAGSKKGKSRAPAAAGPAKPDRPPVTRPVDPHTLSADGLSETRPTRPARLTEAPAVRTKPSADGKPKPLSVRLVGLPEKAEVRLDGKIVTPPLKVTGDGRRHKLEVRAPGFKPATRTFAASPDTTSITIRMTKTGRSATTRRRRRRAAGKGSKVPRVTKSGIYEDPYNTK